MLDGGGRGAAGRGAGADLLPAPSAGRPDKLRIEHLPALGVPCLFIHGTRDPFATPAELETATAAIPGPVVHEWIDNGRHDLAGADARIAELVAAWLPTLR